MTEAQQSAFDYLGRPKGIACEARGADGTVCGCYPLGVAFDAQTRPRDVCARHLWLFWVLHIPNAPHAADWYIAYLQYTIPGCDAHGIAATMRREFGEPCVPTIAKVS